MSTPSCGQSHLDQVSNAREELLVIERKLERLKAGIAKVQEKKVGPARDALIGD
jgi:hypothetical protein